MADKLYLKSCAICLANPLDKSGDDHFIHMSRSHKLELADAKEASRLASQIKRNVVLADDLGITHKRLKDIMQAYKIAALIRFTAITGSEANTKVSSFGYIALGQKQSGAVFTDKDLAFINSVTQELVIGIQNTLHYEQVKHFNVLLQDKVREATNELRAANRRLKLLDETKDDFISMASHQLRTPLTSIKGYLSMVLDGDAGKLTKTQHEMLHQSFVSSQRMVYLISDLLNVSRLNTGKFVIQKTRINLPKIVAEEVEQLEESAALRKIKLVYKRPLKFPDVMLDEPKIRQVIMNFIDNAIYYSPAGGKVEVVLKQTENTIEFRVKDSGIGVPKAEQYRLFTKFYRAQNARRIRPDGTGLGLFMAKKVVVAQGGAILFTSKEGKGSTFGFSFAKSKIVVKTIDYTL